MSKMRKSFKSNEINVNRENKTKQNKNIHIMCIKNKKSVQSFVQINVVTVMAF